jgi:hypothetical protein
MFPEMEVYPALILRGLEGSAPPQGAAGRTTRRKRNKVRVLTVLIIGERLQSEESQALIASFFRLSQRRGEPNY